MEFGKICVTGADTVQVTAFSRSSEKMHSTHHIKGQDSWMCVSPCCISIRALSEHLQGI